MRSASPGLLAFYLLLSLAARSQVAGTVLFQENKRVAELVTVELFSLPDSTRKAVSITDKKGRFEFESVDIGHYFISCSYTGYRTTVVPFTMEQERIQLPHIFLSIDSTILEEVKVSGRRQLVNAGIDRKIYMVDQDLMSTSGSVTDILRNVPSVEVDIEGNISLRGSGEVIILINGRPSLLVGRSPAEILQQLPAGSVERIEVITNPSARFKPDGSGGMINIVMKKNALNGFFMTPTVNIGNRERYNGNIVLNYKKGKTNFFGSYGYRHDNRRRSGNVSRNYLDSATGQTEKTFEQVSQSRSQPKSHIVRGGVDITLDERKSLGFSGDIYSRRQARNDSSSNITTSASGQLEEAFDRKRSIREGEESRSASVYYEKKFKKEDTELRLEWNGETEKETESMVNQNRFTMPGDASLRDNTSITGDNSEQEWIADFTTSVGEEGELEAGYEGSFNKTDIDFAAEKFDHTTNGFVKDASRSNRFIYEETIHAWYGTMNQAMEKFGWQLGLRAEVVNGNGLLKTMDSSITNSYFKIYPTVHLSYQLSERSELRLNYSKRVNRPDGDELNPFPESQDPRNLSAGNPNLEPEITHSFEFGYQVKSEKINWTPSLYYRYRMDAFTPVTRPLNDSVMITTIENLGSDRSAGLEMVWSFKMGEKLNSHISSNLFYNQVQAVDEEAKRSIISGSLNGSSTFSVSKSFMLQVSGNYRAARQTAQGKTYPTFQFNAGLRKSFFNGKLNLTLTGSDIFLTQRQRTRLDAPDFRQVSTSRRDGQIFFLGLNYRFGFQPKEKEEVLEFEVD